MQFTVYIQYKKHHIISTRDAHFCHYHHQGLGLKLDLLYVIVSILRHQFCDLIQFVYLTAS